MMSKGIALRPETTVGLPKANLIRFIMDKMINSNAVNMIINLTKITHFKCCDGHFPYC